MARTSTTLYGGCHRGWPTTVTTDFIMGVCEGHWKGKTTAYSWGRPFCSARAFRSRKRGCDPYEWSLRGDGYRDMQDGGTASTAGAALKTARQAMNKCLKVQSTPP